MEAYPLSWPLHIPRNKSPKRSRFKHTQRHASDRKSRFVHARDGVYNELRLLGAKSVVISSNVPLKLDGQPRASFKTPDDKGVAVYFMISDEQKVIACDMWDSLTDNLHAIHLSIAAIRGLERWKCSNIINSVFAGDGFRALPESATPSTWRGVLGVATDANLSEVKQAYRSLVKRSSNEELYIVNDAWEAAKREFALPG